MRILVTTVYFTERNWISKILYCSFVYASQTTLHYFFCLWFAAQAHSNLKGICSKHWKIASQKTKLVRCKCVCVLKCMPHLKRATSRRWNFAGYPQCLRKLMLPHLKSLWEIILRISQINNYNNNYKFQQQLTVSRHKQSLLHNKFGRKLLYTQFERCN